MTTIVFMNSKGGAGKTTSALLLANQLSKHTPVTLIDADPNRPIKRWATGQDGLDNLTIIDDATEANILDKIDDAETKTPAVIVDLEGTASRIVFMAIGRADFIIIPSQGSDLDAAEVGKAISAIKQAEKSLSRTNKEFKLHYAVLLTRTTVAVRSRTLRHVENTFVSAGIPMFETELNERDAFKAMVSFHVPLEKLDRKDVSNLDKAIENAEAFKSEVVRKLQEINND